MLFSLLGEKIVLVTSGVKNKVLDLNLLIWYLLRVGITGPTNESHQQAMYEGIPDVPCL